MSTEYVVLVKGLNSVYKNRGVSVGTHHGRLALADAGLCSLLTPQFLTQFEANSFVPALLRVWVMPDKRCVLDHLVAS